MITISDRASRKQYETGDLSGKAMIEIVNEYDEVFDQEYLRQAVIVPDDKEQIERTVTGMLNEDK